MTLIIIIFIESIFFFCTNVVYCDCICSKWETEWKIKIARARQSWIRKKKNNTYKRLWWKQQRLNQWILRLNRLFIKTHINQIYTLYPAVKQLLPLQFALSYTRAYQQPTGYMLYVCFLYIKRLNENMYFVLNFVFFLFENYTYNRRINKNIL